MRTHSQSWDHQALESHVAARLAHGLSSGINGATARLPHDVLERLRAGRERALDKARQLRPALQAAPVAAGSVGQSGGSAVLSAGGQGWFGNGRLPGWLPALLPLLMLVVGLVLIGQFAKREQIRVAVEIDSRLLADDLPPTAFSDPGFVQFLRRGGQP